MRVAVTADLHLRESNPERLENLEMLIDQLLSREILLLVIAGDLFDSADGSYTRIDSLAKRFPKVQLLILPGNHDPQVRQGLFAARNIQVFAKPTLKSIDQRLFLFLPYTEGATMGETIAGLPEAGRLKAQPWILVSHGDLAAPRRQASGLERGYFPLTREDLARFRPERVILGHIHIPNSTADEVLYPGSPYPITADEYGQRRVLILDTESAAVEEFPLTHPPVYLRAEIFLIPDGREKEQIRTQIDSLLDNTAPTGRETADKLIIQAVLKGYTSSRRRAQEFIDSVLSERQVRCSGVDLESLRVNDEESLATLAATVREKVAELELGYSEVADLRHEVLVKALQIVYGA